MNYHTLGKTGLQVSEIALGTVSLGLDYGIEAPGEFGRPSESDAIQLLQTAADAGINFFDTAPSYGESERLVGLALGSRTDCYFATKVSIPKDVNGDMLRGRELRENIRSSLEKSLRLLERSVLDIVQIHNATLERIKSGEIADVLLEARREGMIRYLGASVYNEQEALAIIQSGCFDMLQVAYNILDQRMAQCVFPEAEQAGVGVIMRSAFLKGVLSPKAQFLPSELLPLRRAVESVRDAYRAGWQDLPELALRFCISSPYLASVLVGARTVAELDQALRAMEQGPLPLDLVARLSGFALSEEHLLNPTHWRAH